MSVCSTGEIWVNRSDKYSVLQNCISIMYFSNLSIGFVSESKMEWLNFALFKKVIFPLEDRWRHIRIFSAFSFCSFYMVQVLSSPTLIILKFTHFSLALTNLISRTDSNQFFSGVYTLRIGIFIFIRTAINWSWQGIPKES